jgi:hypothetical protein
LLKGPGGQNIACWGEKQVEVVFSGRRFRWLFLLAQVDFAILGADFLKHFGLVVDLAAGRLLDTVTLQCFPAAVTPVSPPMLRGGLFAAVAATPQEFRAIFSEFQDVANQSEVMPPATHDVVHHIVTDGPPATAHFRRLDPAKLLAAKRDFAKLEAEGIIRRSSSSWSSPLHMVL